MLAVALDNSVYLWSASSGDILQLLQMEQPGEYISSVAWIKEGNYLAVGTSSAEVQVRPVPLPQACGAQTQGACLAGAGWDTSSAPVGTSGTSQCLILAAFSLQLWDVQQQKRLRNMTGHSARVSSLCWNSYILSRCVVLAGLLQNLSDFCQLSPEMHL